MPLKKDPKRLRRKASPEGRAPRGFGLALSAVLVTVTPPATQAQERLSPPCGNIPVSEATWVVEYERLRVLGFDLGARVSEGTFAGFDSTSTYGLTRDSGLCERILSELPDDLKHDILDGAWEFRIEQYGDAFVIGLCPPLAFTPELRIDDGCNGYAVRREGDELRLLDVVLVYW